MGGHRRLQASSRHAQAVRTGRRHGRRPHFPHHHDVAHRPCSPQELALDGNPQLNLASFVTTYMEPEADDVVLVCVCVALLRMCTGF